MGKYLWPKSSSSPRCLPDTKEQVAQTMEGTGLGQRLANAFLKRIAIVKGKR
jgi:hypothetical protein